MIFKHYASVGIAGDFAKATPTLAQARPAAAPPGAKRLQKAKKPTCLGEAFAETEARLPVTAYRREAGSPFSKREFMLGSLKMSRIYNPLIL